MHMKKILLLIILGAGGTALYSQTVFQKLFNQEASVEVAIDAASNGDLLLVSDSYNDTASFFHRLIYQRLDADGNSLQSTGLFIWPPPRLGSIAASSDNGLIITGTYGDPLSDEDSVFVMKMDANAGIAWSKAFQIGPDIHEVGGILETNDGGFIVYGLFEDFNVFNATIFMVKLNANGDWQWTRKINSQLAGAFLKVGGLAETANGDLYLSGSTRFNSEGSWMAKLNGSGLLQSVKFYDTHKLTDSQPEPFAFFERSNGDWDIFYNHTSFQDASFLLNLRTDANGTPIFTRRYYLNHSNGGEITSVYPKGTDGYLMAGYHFPNGIRSNGIAMEIDANDNVLWFNQYGTSYIEILTGIVSASDGGYFMGGFADPDSIIISPSENGLFPWLLKTDAIGKANCHSNSLPIFTADTNTTSTTYQLSEAAGTSSTNTQVTTFALSPVVDTVTCTFTAIEKLPETSFHFFPNPTNGLVQLVLEKPIPGAILSIFNPLGKEIEQFRLDHQLNLELELEGEAGLYFIFLLTPDGKRLGKKLWKNK
jgi:hypothetical protein